MGPEGTQAYSITCCECTRKETIMARLPIPGQDADNWGAVINDFLRVAHNENGTLQLGLDEVDATKIGVVAEDSQKAKANSLAINQFLANPQVNGVPVPPRLVLPSGVPEFTSRARGYSIQGMERSISVPQEPPLKAKLGFLNVLSAMVALRVSCRSRILPARR